MSEYPEEGLYRITFGPYTAIVHTDDNVLRGEPILGSHLWSLKYDVDRDDGIQMCTLTDVETKGYLGVHSIENDQPVYRLNDPQAWFLKKTEDGYTRLSMNNFEYFWYFAGDGEPIIISDKEPQSWLFTKVG